MSIAVSASDVAVEDSKDTMDPHRTAEVVPSRKD
jgi:hypothetical protein